MIVEHGVRRFALGKRYDAEQQSLPLLAEVWKAKQLAEPSEDLPDDFPYRDRLIATGYYLGLADLAGATVDELTEFGCGTIGYYEACEIVRAYELQDG